MEYLTKRIAIHEAGHAVSALALGFNPSCLIYAALECRDSFAARRFGVVHEPHVEIELPTADQAPAAASGIRRGRILCHLSGAAACSVFDDRPDHRGYFRSSAYEDVSACSQDCAALGVKPENLWSEARALCSDVFPAILRVAECLGAAAILAGEEIVEIASPLPERWGGILSMEIGALPPRFPRSPLDLIAACRKSRIFP